MTKRTLTPFQSFYAEDNDKSKDWFTTFTGRTYHYKEALRKNNSRHFEVFDLNRKIYGHIIVTSQPDNQYIYLSLVSDYHSKPFLYSQIEMTFPYRSDDMKENMFQDLLSLCITQLEIFHDIKDAHRNTKDPEHPPLP